MIGRILEKYQLLEEVGQGGMAVVYRGLDQSLGREVAIKVLHPHLAAMPEAKSRLEREAKAVAKLRHDNILEIYDYSGSASTESFIVTEYIKGQTLREFTQKHEIPYPEIAAMLVSEVAGALVHAHGLGVLHRDIKPENLMIRDDGMLKLMDFGIAQVVDTRRMTVTGQILGSPAYMAPEHVEGRPLDFRSDVFALGVVLYQLASGELPFKGRNAHEILKKIADGKYLDPRVANIQIGARLGGIIDRALARDPEERYPDMKRMLDDVLAYLAEADVDDPRKELKKFFADPAGYAKTFRPKLIATLVRRGKDAKLQRKSARALELWNRVLTLDPENQEVLAAIDQLGRRRRLGRVATAVGALLLLGGLGAGIAWKISQGGDGDDARAGNLPAGGAGGGAGAAGLVAADAGLKVTVAPRADAGLVDAAIAVASGEPDAGKPKHVKEHPVGPAVVKQPEKLRHVELVPAPKAVKVFLDGRELGWYGPDTRVLELKPGAHHVKLSNEACFDGEATIGADDDPGRLPMRLKWKPASLTVRSKNGTDVIIDEKPRGQPGRAINVQIPPLSEDGTAEIVVKVSAEGLDSRSQRVTVHANKPTDVTVDLQPSG